MECAVSHAWLFRLVVNLVAGEKSIETLTMIRRHSAPACDKQPGRISARVTAVLASLLLGLSAFGSEIDILVVDKGGQPVGAVAVYALRLDGHNDLPTPASNATMDQLDRQFVPHLLTIQTGTAVEFPNSDTVAHHVYSFSHPNKFVLPMYKGKQHSPVTFDQRWVSMIIDILFREVYLFGLIAVFMIGGMLREGGYFAQFYNKVASLFDSKRAVLFIMSLIGGILPVEGRCSVSAPFIDSITDKDSKGRSKMGIVDYLSTHHYYLWSPIEPSVLIFMSVLGLSYASFLQVTLLPLIAYLFFLLAMIVIYVREDDIDLIEFPEYLNNAAHVLPMGRLVIATFIATLFIPFYVTFPLLTGLLAYDTNHSFKEMLKYVNWTIIQIVGIIIAIATYLGTKQEEYIHLLTDQPIHLGVLLFCVFLASLMMGSSTKFAGLGAAVVAATNIAILPLVLIAEFIGYLFSPAHKCFSICKLYFKTKMGTMYGFLLLLSVFLAAASVVTFDTLS